IAVWDVHSHKCIFRAAKGESELQATFSPKGQTLVVTSPRSLSVWDSEFDREPLKMLLQSVGEPIRTYFVFSRDGAILVSVTLCTTQDGRWAATIARWGMPDLKNLGTWQLDDTMLGLGSPIALSPDEKLLALPIGTAGPSRIGIFDFARGQIVQEFEDDRLL